MFNKLHRQDRLGKRADIGFKSEAWTVVRDTVQDVYTGHIVIEVSQLKNKESNYKALYKDWKWLKEQSGFGRDPDTGAITASLQAWTDVIKVYFYCLYMYIYLIIKVSQNLWMASIQRSKIYRHLRQIILKRNCNWCSSTYSPIPKLEY